MRALARQTSLNVFFEPKLVAGRNAPAVKGQVSTEEALKELLKDSGLTFRHVDDKTFTIVVAGADDEASFKVNEVVVTGSRIHGANSTSPLHVLGRVDIDRTGYSQVGDVIRSLPENFSGGQNPGVLGADSGNLANQNGSNASTVNLRGLGSDATLVLLNGHRLAGDTFFQGSDISGIPLGAIQRIEIVPDGASALYGADAVAGVVNFVLRQDFSGVETGARIGSATQGGGTEQTYSALGGISRERWHALLNFEYSKQDEINASQRDFTAQAPPNETLLHPQERRSLFLNAGANLTDGIRASFDALLSDRKSDSVGQITTATSTTLESVDTPAYSAAASVDFDLPGTWKLHVTGVASGSHNNSRLRIPASNYASTVRYRNDVKYGEATADGDLFELPTGALKVALGGGYRNEGYRNGQPADVANGSFYESSRDVSYIYGEAIVPLVRVSDARIGLQELELSLAARTEHYSDFGSSTNPKIGLRYVPIPTLALRGTWGKSFKAPSFSQTSQPAMLYLYPAVWLGYPGAGNAMVTWGGNPDLRPETSKSRTIGADFTPAFAESAKLSVTYFHIDYTDRVIQPISNLATGLSNPLYVPFVRMSPSAAEQQALVAAAPTFLNSTTSPYDPADVVAVLQDKYANATSQNVSGVDVSYRQTLSLSQSQLDLFANGSWLKFDQRSISTAPSSRLSGTIFNPPGFKARGGVTWRRGDFSATGTINYIASEDDTNVLPSGHIASWTTLDASVSYDLSRAQGFARGLRLALSGSNLFDRDPPASAQVPYFTGLNFDSTNSSIIGRFISASVVKSW
ncbi:MAG: TonB-dependent receptor [Gammaproteobacteria bacterium]